MEEKDSRIARELLKLSGADNRKEVVVREKPIPSKIHSTEYFWKKSRAISDQVKALRSNVEWAGYILAKKSDPELAMDIMMTKEQSRSASVDIQPESIGAMMERLEKELTITGTIHYFPPLHSFSPTDVGTIKNMSHDAAKNTQKIWKYVDSGIDKLGMLSAAGGSDSLTISEYGKLTKISKENLRSHDLTMIVHQTGGVASGEANDLRFLVPYNVGWCYNIIVCDKTVPGSRDNISKCISVIESDPFGFLPVRAEYFRDIEIDEPVKDGREVDVDKIIDEVKRYVNQHSVLNSVRGVLGRKEKPAQAADTAETATAAYAPESTDFMDAQLFVIRLQRLKDSMDPSVMKILEEKTGSPLYGEVGLAARKLTQYKAEHPDISGLILDVVSNMDAPAVEGAIRRYVGI